MIEKNKKKTGLARRVALARRRVKAAAPVAVIKIEPGRIRACYGVPLPLFRRLYKKKSLNVKSLRRGSMKQLPVYRIPGTEKLLFLDARDLKEDTSFQSALPKFSDLEFEFNGEQCRVEVARMVEEIANQSPKNPGNAWWSPMMKGKGKLVEDFEYVGKIGKIKGGKVYGSSEYLKEVLPKKKKGEKQE